MLGFYDPLGIFEKLPKPEKWVYVPEEKPKKRIIREYDKDGKLVKETIEE